jgi:hypothetical protein
MIYYMHASSWYCSTSSGKLFYADGEVFVGEWAWGRQLESAGQIVAANEALKKNLTVANSKFKKQFSAATFKMKKNMSDMVLGAESE